MVKPRLAWAVTGSGHYIEECLAFMLTLDAVDLYISPAGEEVLKMYGISLNDIRIKMPVYRDKAASSPPVGHFYKGYYHTFVMAPTTSNTVAKCVLGIADNLVTNLYSQSGKESKGSDQIDLLISGSLINQFDLTPLIFFDYLSLTQVSAGVLACTFSIHAENITKKWCEVARYANSLILQSVAISFNLRATSVKARGAFLIQNYEQDG